MPTKKNAAPAAKLPLSTLPMVGSPAPKSDLGPQIVESAEALIALADRLAAAGQTKAAEDLRGAALMARRVGRGV